MIGIIIILFLSWLLLWLMEKKQLTVLGLELTKKRLKDFFIGLVMASLVCSVYHIINVYWANNFWICNQKISTQMILNSLWWILKSVLFEELIFRGALLYIAINRLGTKWACILSAIAFGVYHWFSYGSFGNPIQMLIILVMTGSFGWALAFAFKTTRSLYLPIAIHLGWNLVNILVFSNGPIGPQLMIKANDNHLEGLISLCTFLFQIFALPLLTYWYVKRFAKE
ncbi:CPBP family intramembrane glutamic endopeptidase [Chryseobacterium sp. ISL-6]|uniref:CPBP family intramembrane glutamic endopeptidase n=1 Tax=Chryseobacterium sp. ISL-6 TaxID=2819143 RepID=UPI001BEB53C7|nr:CPBP family intramembrane glutamic endopeptidase [Chryseobacterium sp. ISL-6]MBT2620093.1 CPBP family intramembrane metalloprotease [Chryseobacterium sp. ISL-6]